MESTLWIVCYFMTGIDRCVVSNIATLQQSLSAIQVPNSFTNETQRDDVSNGVACLLQPS